jgi:hypothetical protein
MMTSPKPATIIVTVSRPALGSRPNAMERR